MKRQREGEILKNEKRDKIASILAEKPLSIQDSKFCFIEDAIIPEKTAGTGVFGFLQDTLKKYPTIYRFIVTQLSPVLASREYRKLLQYSIGQLWQRQSHSELWQWPEDFE